MSKQHKHVYTSIVSYFNDPNLTKMCILGSPRCTCGEHSRLCGCKGGQPEPTEKLNELPPLLKDEEKENYENTHYPS